MPMVTGHLARLQTGLDFVNTLDLWPVPHDHLDSPTAALDWLVEHDLMHGEARLHLVAQYGASPASGTETLARLRRVRQAMRGVLEAAAAHQAPKAADLDEINRALRTHYIYELVPAPDGVSLDHRHQGDPVDGAIARLSESIARELIQGDTGRLRICENPNAGGCSRTPRAPGSVNGAACAAAGTGPRSRGTAPGERPSLANTMSARRGVRAV